MIQVFLVDFTVDRQPKDAPLYEAAQRYCVEQFGSERPLDRMLRVWLVADAEENVVKQILGILCIRQVLDIPTFHVPKLDDKRKVAEARDALITRARGYVEDNGGKGMDVLVHVASDCPLGEFAEKLGAVEAHRYSIEV